MTKKESKTDDTELTRLAIEEKIPLKAVGIENIKEANPKHMPPHRYLHPWWARRPTPASRLAILSSVMPADTTRDELLELMQIGPKEQITGSIEEYVENKKASENDRSGTLGEHYGYPRPFTQSPSKSQLDDLHATLRDTWNGELPSVLDPTAGGGVIPFEALRYDLPTVANELNSVPSLMLKVMLEYAPKAGSIKQEATKWADEIDNIASDQLDKYFPSSGPDQSPSHYACTYTIECRECGCDIPLVKKWWLRKRSANNGVSARPTVQEDGTISYSCVELPEDVTKTEFDPQDGPHDRGGAECLNCGVVTQSDAIRESLNSGDFNYEIYGVKYINHRGGSGFRAPTSEDKKVVKEAEERINSEFELSTLLSVDRYVGKEDRAAPYGVKEWRDTFSPRQLLTHYEYLQAFDEVKPEIQKSYDQDTAEAILTLLTLIASKTLDRNSRASPIDTSKGYPSNAVGGKLFSLQWAFVDNNLIVGDQCYQDVAEKCINSYEELVSYLQNNQQESGKVLNQDAADLPIDDNSIQAVVIDPPYYDAIIYSELSDFFYVWMKEYLDDILPDLFQDKLTNKTEEAVANVAEYEDVAGKDSSSKNLAKEDYETKMSDIFNELHRVLEPGGVMTVMFTHKEADAWDTLTMSLINSGFTITSTHPITSEIPQRVSQQGNASADSTLLLTGRKRLEENNDRDNTPTLWSDVKADTREAAKGAARDLLNSGLSLTKTDVIISAYGPTLRVFADSYPVVDDQDNTVPPRRALEEAREAVTRVLVDEYLVGEDLDTLDDITEWYILSWLVHESDVFDYDDGYQLGLGIGVDIDDIKSSTKIWGKKRGSIQLKTHNERVQDITLPKEERSSRTPVNPESLSYTIALDAVHAAMHIYEKKGEDAAIDWLKERNYDSDAAFKATLKALLQVLPPNHSEWEAARDLTLGRAHDALKLDFTPTEFAENSGIKHQQSEITDHT